MAKEPKLPKSYEYSTVESDAETKGVQRGLRASKLTVFASTVVLAGIGATGAWALVSNLNAPSPLDQAPMSSVDNSTSGANSAPSQGQPGINPGNFGGSGRPVVPGNPSNPGAVPQPSGTTLPGSTIAVPPATFNDDGDTRQFHDYDDNGDQFHNPKPGFGNGHKPHPSATPSFSNSGSDDSNDDSGADN